MTACCLWCGKEIKNELKFIDLVAFRPLSEIAICKACNSQLYPLKQELVCKGCGRKQSEPLDYCLDCIKWQQEYPDYAFNNIALFRYEGMVKEMIEAYKFKGDYRLNKLFARPLHEQLCNPRYKKKLIVPIPISKKSFQLREFNQVTGLLEAAGILYEEVLLNKGIAEKQSKKNRQERLATIQPFAVSQEKKEMIKGRQLVLVDDVYTTGRTLFHAADCLIKNGVQSVETVTLTR
ncbi:MAG: ComF family protein [Pisciglobus halotolerans]|nr:ComF family protein [Pisciglobus halotolerans]